MPVRRGRCAVQVPAGCPVRLVGPLLMIAAALALWSGLQFRDRSRLEDRALAAEAAVATLRPLADSLRVEAERRDTVLAVVTDTVQVVVTRERVVQVAVVDSLRVRLDSAETVLLDSLVASHAEEVAALERLAQERLLWGQGWRDAYDGLAAELGATREALDAYRELSRPSLLDRIAGAMPEVGVGVLVTIGVLLLAP